ncbi:MAG: hypothetical protein ACFHU9_16930 [Fluviicola sp.]
MKLIIVVVFWLVAGSLCAQGDVELYSIIPDWKKGEKRTITSETVSIIYVSDTVFQETNVSATHYIEVIEVEPLIKLRAFQKQNRVDFETESVMPGVDKKLNDLVEELTYALEEVEFILEFDPELGQVTQLLNEDEVISLMKEAAIIFVNNLLPEDLTKEEKEKSVAQYELMVSSFKDQMVQTFVNGINVSLQPYSFNYPIDGETHSEEILTYEVNAIDPSVTDPVPAVLHITGIEEGNSIKVRTTTDYDIDNILAQLKRTRKNVNLDSEKWNITDESTFSINLNTTWIEEMNSSIECTFENIRVLDTTKVVYTED